MRILKVILLSGVVSCSAFGEGVVGGNGPDQEGQAVPLGVGQGTTLGQLKDAFGKCVAHYFRNVSDILTPEAPKEVTCILKTPEINAEIVENDRQKVYQMNWYCEGPQYWGAVGLFKTRVPYKTGAGEGCNRASDLVINNSKGERHCYLGSNLPNVSYRLSFPESVVDIYGVIQPGAPIVNDVIFENFYPEPVRLFTNVHYGKKLGIEWDTQETKACIERELAPSSGY